MAITILYSEFVRTPKSLNFTPAIVLHVPHDVLQTLGGVLGLTLGAALGRAGGQGLAGKQSPGPGPGPAYTSSRGS